MHADKQPMIANPNNVLFNTAQHVSSLTWLIMYFALLDNDHLQLHLISYWSQFLFFPRNANYSEIVAYTDTLSYKKGINCVPRAYCQDPDIPIH